MTVVSVEVVALDEIGATFGLVVGFQFAVSSCGSHYNEECGKSPG